MESSKRIFFKQNTLFGSIVGLTFILTSFTYLMMGKNINVNPQLNNVIMLLSIAGIFIGVRKYREDHLQGIISYGKALKTCIYLITVASVVYGIYIYFIYKFNAGILSDYTEKLENILNEVYAGSPMLENMISVIKMFTTPATIAFTEIFNKILSGAIFSFFLAGMLRKNISSPF